MDTCIREMTKSDIPIVQDIARESWHDTYEGIIPVDIQDRFLNSAYHRRNMKRRLKQSHIFVAEVKGKVVGFANYSPVSKDRSVELGAIYLYPAYQGQGLGTKLLIAGVEKLKPEKIYLYVEKNNVKGMRFYQARGFKKVKEFEDELYGHPLQTVQMVLEINEMENQSRKAEL